jgi:NAD(P)-binding Rossmann-like domain
MEVPRTTIQKIGTYPVIDHDDSRGLASLGERATKCHCLIVAIKEPICNLRMLLRSVTHWIKTRPSVVAVSFRRELHKIAIVGSGPGGCYTAKYLQSSLEKKGLPDYCIDIIDRQATLGGLVRFGVAPDHPEVKNALNDFESLFSSPRIQFYGNVTLGRDVQLDDLRRMYDAVVLAYGCESSQTTGLLGEDLQGVMSAREFVAWYNGKLFHNRAQLWDCLGYYTNNGRMAQKICSICFVSFRENRSPRLRTRG